jgi:hypothetical protein
MMIEQIIEVPADHRILLELPVDLRGKAKIALRITPLEAVDLRESKRAAFQSFMKFRKAAPPDFDYQKELVAALEEKYGRIG